MEKFPLSLSCLTLSHVIDDVNSVEGYLAEDPSAADCLPIILRDTIFNSELNKKYGLSERGIPNAMTTLKYLVAFWRRPYQFSGYRTQADRVISAAISDLTYLIPFLTDRLDLIEPYRNIVLTDALYKSAYSASVPTVKVLIDLGAIWPDKPLTSLINHRPNIIDKVVDANNIPVAMYLLSLLNDRTLQTTGRQILKMAIVLLRHDLVAAIRKTYPNIRL